MAVDLAGKVIDSDGDPKASLTVDLWEAATWETYKDGGSGARTATATTDADGLWAFTGQDITKTWLVAVLDGTGKYFLIDSRNSIQLTKADFITDINTNTINEHTSGSGVTIDGLIIKDSMVLDTALKAGRDSDNLIDFATTDNKIIFRVEGVNEVELVQNALSPVTSDGVALGTTSLMWSDLFVASGGVLNFNNGDVTITHSSNTLTVAGGTLAAAAVTGTTIDATTDFTIGDTVVTDGVITDSTGLQLAADLDIDGAADISGDLTLSAGGDGALRFSAASSIKILDNSSTALVIEEADNAYITFVTTNGSEAITVAKATTFSSTIAAATGSTIGNLTLANGSITDSGGALDFGNETLTTTGAVDFGAATVDSLSVSDGNITNVGDIALDTISADGSTITITGNTTFADGAYDFNIASHDGTNGLALAGTVVTTTAAELNLIDGGTARGTTAIADGDGVLINDGGTMRMTTVETLATYMESEINAFSLATTFSNTLTVGVDDTGYDVKFFGATTGAYLLYDESADRLVLNQGTEDGSILDLQSSDVSQAATSVADAATFGDMQKRVGGSGGLFIRGFSEALEGVVIEAYCASDNDDKTTGAGAPLVFFANKVSGTSRGAQGSDANICVMYTFDTCRFIFDAEGDFHYDGSLEPFADEFDDAHLVRALDYVREAKGTKGLIRSRWDDFVKYSENTLIELGILGDTIENGGLINMTGLQRLHNSAIWQGHTRQQEMQERIEALETKLLALEGGS